VILGRVERMLPYWEARLGAGRLSVARSSVGVGAPGAGRGWIWLDRSDRLAEARYCLGVLASQVGAWEARTRSAAHTQFTNDAWTASAACKRPE
jgi:hypothetical protein